jgi:hypothetical protein
VHLHHKARDQDSEERKGMTQRAKGAIARAVQPGETMLRCPCVPFGAAERWSCVREWNSVAEGTRICAFAA